MALIELDRDAPAAPPASRPPARYFRYVAFAVVALLTLALGGASPIEPVLWRPDGLAALGGASTSYQLVGGVLYTLDGNSNRRTTTAWGLEPAVHKLWSLSTPLQLDDTGTVIHDDLTTLSVAGRFLVQNGATGITVIDPATGHVRWTSDLPVLTGTATSGLIQVPEFAAGTTYDQSSGAPGQLYFSVSGVPHTSPPERTVLRGLDLATGRERWRRTEPGSVYVTAAGDPTDGYMVISADRVSLLDGRTGAVLRSQTLPRITSESYPDVIGDVVLLATDLTVRAISRTTFAPLWLHTESIGVRADQGSCLGLLCDTGRDTIAVLDPATGAARWTAANSALLIARGPAVLEERSDSQAPVALRDPGSGRTRVDLRRWETVADSDPGDPIVLFKFAAGTAQAEFGALLPGASKVQPLGRSAGRVRECSSDARYVACRIDGGVEVWAYRA